MFEKEQVTGAVNGSERESAEAETESEDCKARLARGQGRGGRKLPLGINSVVGDQDPHPSLPLPSPLEPPKYPPSPAAADTSSDHCLRSKAPVEGEGERGRGRGEGKGEGAGRNPQSWGNLMRRAL